MADKPEEWSYGILMQSLQLPANVDQMRADVVAEGFAYQLPKIAEAVTNAMKHLPNGLTGGEPISHSMVRVGSTLLVTILFRHRTP